MPCIQPVTHVAPAPPAAIVVRTGCGTYEIRANGLVRPFRRNWAPTWAPAAVSHPARDVWVAHPHGRLAVYRGGHLLWRSRIKVPSDDVAVGGSTIAFAIWRRSELPTLWMARVGGREFRVAQDEDSIGWTRGGLVTQSGSTISVRGPDGARYRMLALGRSP